MRTNATAPHDRDNPGEAADPPPESMSSWWRPCPSTSRLPSPISAHACAKPPVIATTFVRPLTATGVEELVNVPLPNCPSKLPPQHLTVPAANSAHECATPPEIVIATAPLRPLTATGIDESVVVPLPSWP